MTATAVLERRYLVVAKRHWGKTTYAMFLVGEVEREREVAATFAFVLQSDAADIYRAHGFVEVRSIAAGVAAMQTHTRIMFRPPVACVEVIMLAARARDRMPHRALLLVIDELVDPELCTGGDDPQLRIPELRRLVVVERGCSLIATTAVPSGIPMMMRQMCEEWFIGRLPHDAAILRLKKCGVPVALLEQVQSPDLPPYQFATWQTD